MPKFITNIDTLKIGDRLPSIAKIEKGMHHLIVCIITGKEPLRGNDGKWVYTFHAETRITHPNQLRLDI